MITVEAVEAAAISITEMRMDGSEHTPQEYARAALGSAAPHMLAEVLSLHQEDLFRGHLSNGCKTCSGGEWPCATYTAALGATK